MAEPARFLLGKGERLTGPVDVRRPAGPKQHPYTLADAKGSLLPQFRAAAETMEKLPERVCPGGNAVALVTLHPSYLAKSYFPHSFLKDAGLDAVGSRAREVTPRKPIARKRQEEGPAKGSETERAVTTQLYVSGSVARFEELPDRLTAAREGTAFAQDMIKLEELRVQAPEDRVRPLQSREGPVLLEAVLHLGHGPRFRRLVVEGFEAYLRAVNAEGDFDRTFEADALLFMRVRTPRERVRDVAAFTFLRVVREMPRLRQFRPFFRGVPGMEAFRPDLPRENPVDPHTRVAIFDGGLPAKHGLERWVEQLEVGDTGTALPEFQQHGLAVTSAVLFGSLEEDAPPARPAMKVHHYRVLDTETGKDPQSELYEVLDRIRDVLDRQKYSFVNLSIGPDLPVEDDDPSAWTTVLDQRFGKDGALATVAVGNGGEENPDTGFRRIQPPSDCVNAVGVGACDSRGDSWKRATYSCVGPGRCPGFIKPDLVAFGGSRKEPFWVLDARKPGHASAITGTSFAAPTALRLGTQARAHFGEVLSPLAIKALLVQRCDDRDLPRDEVGWGRVAGTVADLMTCGEGQVHVLFQGTLSPKKWMRAPIPVPEELAGMVTVGATICFATAIDPQDSVNYTRSGVEVVFRPHADRRTPDKKTGQVPVHADSRSFFGRRLYGDIEQELRAEAHKWETIIRHAERMQSRTLKDPVFDIHYVAREEGRDTAAAEKIPYALVVTIEAPKTKDIFDKTLRRYPVLQQLRPVVQIPIPIR